MWTPPNPNGWRGPRFFREGGIEKIPGWVSKLQCKVKSVSSCELSFSVLVFFLILPLVGFTLVFRGKCGTVGSNLEMVAFEGAPGWSPDSSRTFCLSVSCVSKPYMATETATHKMVSQGSQFPHTVLDTPSAWGSPHFLPGNLHHTVCQKCRTLGSMLRRGIAD